MRNFWGRLSRNFSTDIVLTEYEVRKMLKKGISPIDIKKFTTERYSRAKDTRELIDALYFGDSERSKMQNIAKEIMNEKIKEGF